MWSFINKRQISAPVLLKRAIMLCLFIATLGPAWPVLAQEKYTAIPLPDEGQGSQALALAQAGPGRYGVVGTQQKSDGSVGAIYWNIVVDPVNRDIIYAIELPKPSGWNASATGLVFLEGDPDRPVIIGSLQDGAQSEQAVIWMRNASGQFSNTRLDDEAASRANAIVTRNTARGLIIVVCGKYRLSNGDWHACLWELGSQGRQRTDLGTLGGRQSEATDLITQDDLIGWNVVGSAQLADGLSVAALWKSSWVNSTWSWRSQALPTPQGRQSRANHIAHTRNSDLYIAGAILEPNGQSMANIWINQGEVPSAIFVGNAVGDVLRRRNSTANAIIINGQNGNDILAIGAAWNTENDRTGMGVLINKENLQHPLIFASDLLQHPRLANENPIPLEHFSLNAVEPQGAIAGAGLAANVTTAQAMMLLPAKVEVPGIIAILIGLKHGPKTPGRHAQLWQADGNALSFMASSAHEAPQIVAEFAGTGFSAAAWRAPQRLVLVSRVRPRQPKANPSALLNVQLYDPAFAVWLTVGKQLIAADESFHRTVIEIPDAQRFAVPGGTALRWRLELGGEEWRTWELDLVEWEVASN